MSTTIEEDARFQNSLESLQNYPQNLIHTTYFRHKLEAYTQKIDDLKHDLFDRRKKLVWITELPNDADEFVNHLKEETQRILNSRTLNQGSTDPRCRYIFIQSNSTRGPLGCTRDQLNYILTHHQVSPGFLDILTTFRRCKVPSLFTMFQHESHTSETRHDHAVPSLGRSGLQFEHSFNLISVERSDDGELSPWYIRRTGAYNSFDVADNRSVWIVLKGDRLMRDRINSEVKTHSHMRGSAFKTSEGTLGSILATHLVMMEWAVENWHSYLDYLWGEAMKDSDIAGMTSLDQVAADEPAAVEQLISAPTSRHATFNSRTSSFSIGRRATSFLKRDDPKVSSTGLGLQQIPSGEPSPTPPTPVRPKFTWGSTTSGPNGLTIMRPQSVQSPASPQSPLADNPEYEKMEKVFNFEAIQDLNYARREMLEAVLAIEQNLAIFGEIKQYYTDLLEAPDFQAHMKLDASRASVSRFFSRIGLLEGELNKALGRLQMQINCLDSELKMRYGALQYRGAKWTAHFGTSSLLSAQESLMSAQEMTKWTKEMATIAEKTEQETVSMHFITVLTLIFLPGTFLAVRLLLLPLLSSLLAGETADHALSQTVLTFGQTFFSSGIFHWNEEVKMDGQYQLRGSGLALFGEMCLPLTAAVMVIWVLVYKRCWGRTHARRTEGDEKV